jgi:cytoskeletal protein CcmA (bactofilin family)
MGSEQSRTESDRSLASTPVHQRPGGWIGKSLRVKGTIHSTEDLTIDGDMKGAIEVGG